MPRENEKVIAYFKDGTLVKGRTSDFIPTADTFRVQEEKGAIAVVEMRKLKAVYFVNDFTESQAYRGMSSSSGEGLNGLGRRLEIKFKDGEILRGMALVTYVGRRGFFLAPCESCSPIQKVFILKDSLEHLVELGSFEENFTLPPI